jgi:hypothetical protein
VTQIPTKKFDSPAAVNKIWLLVIGLLWMASYPQWARAETAWPREITDRHGLLANIGGIYIQWKVDGQGSHLNFNPQLGLGTEFSSGDGATYLAAVRLHHFSNAGLKEDNRGVNSIVFVIGRFF